MSRRQPQRGERSVAAGASPWKRLLALALGPILAAGAYAAAPAEKPAAKPAEKAPAAKAPAKPAAAKRTDKEIEKLIQQAAQARDKKDQWPEALRIGEDLVSDPSLDARYRQVAFEIRIEVLRRMEKFEDAVAESERMRKAFPDDKVLQQRAYLGEADMLRQAKKDVAAIDKYREFIKAPATEKAAAAEAQLRIAEVLLFGKKYADCQAEAAKVLEIDPPNDRAGASALWVQAEAAWLSENLEQAIGYYRKLMDPKYFAKRDAYQQHEIRGRPGECLKRLKRFDEMRAHFEACEKAETEPRVAQEWCARAAEACLELGKIDDALRAHERVFVAHPQAAESWYGTQRAIAALLLKQGKFEEALKAVRITFGAAPDEGTIVENVRTIAEILKGMDKNVARANAFIQFQRLGPAGEDGKPGTADDLKDPLAGLPAPSYPERDKAFAEARKAAGDDAKAMYYRAVTYLYSGHPKEALKCFMDAFGRASGDEIQGMGRHMILTGARAARGHAVGLDEFFNFVNYGPAGPDGKPGTADDLKDPFAPLVN